MQTESLPVHLVPHTRKHTHQVKRTAHRIKLALIVMLSTLSDNGAMPHSPALAPRANHLSHTPVENPDPMQLADAQAATPWKNLTPRATLLNKLIQLEGQKPCMLQVTPDAVYLHTDYASPSARTHHITAFECGLATIPLNDTTLSTWADTIQYTVTNQKTGRLSIDVGITTFTHDFSEEDIAHLLDQLAAQCSINVEGAEQKFTAWIGERTFTCFIQSSPPSSASTSFASAPVVPMP